MVDARVFHSLNFVHDQFKIHLLSDNSGYYVFMKNSEYYVVWHLCKYVYLFPSSAECQEILETSYFSGQLMLSDTEFYFNSLDYQTLYFYKITFKSTSDGWTDKTTCKGSYCHFNYAHSFLSTDKKTIYSFYAYGYGLYFVSLATSDGKVVSTIRKFSENVGKFEDSVLVGDNIVFVNSNPSYIAIFNIASNEFATRKFSDNTILNGITFEESNERLIVTGKKTARFSNGYISKFPLGLFDLHPDLSLSKFKTIPLLNEGDDIIQESKEIFSKVFTINVSSSPQNLNAAEATFNLVSTYASDVNYKIQNQIITVLKSSNVKITPDLPCSSSGTTAISYSIVEYNKIPLPDWMSINPNSGELTLITPDVLSDTEFDFNINSSIAGVLNPVLKHIKLVVKFCKVAN